MVRVAEFALDGRRFAPRRRIILWASKRVCQYVVFLVPVVSFLGKIVFLQSLSFLQVIGETNVSSPQVYPHIEFAWIGSGPSMREKNNFSELEKLFFCKARFHPIRPWGVTPQKKCRKGELQTSRISGIFRIWQSYSRAPQILKLLCAWFSWKYVARLGFEPLKFLYSEFFYNTQAASSMVKCFLYITIYTIWCTPLIHII